MAKYCGKCGRKLDDVTGLCSHCVPENNSSHINDNLNQSDNYSIPSAVDKERFPKKKQVFKGIIITISALIVLCVLFFALDYFDVIGTGASKSLGLKSSGSLELYVDSDCVFTSDAGDQTLTFYALPKSGYTPVLKGDIKGELFDDGEVTNSGDIIKRDGVFSLRVAISEKDEKELTVYAVAKNGLSYYKSEPIQIRVKSNWTEEDIAIMDNVDDAIGLLIKEEEYQKMSNDDKTEKLMSLLDELISSGNIKENTVLLNEDELSVSFEYGNGALGVVQIDETSKKEGLLFGDSQDNDSDDKNDSEHNNQEASGANASKPRSLILYDWYTDKPEVQAYYEQYQKDWNDAGLDTTLLVNPSVEQYATQLSDMDLVLIAAHGNRQSIKKGWFSKSITYSTIDTNERISKDTDQAYKTDINEKNIVRVTLNDGAKVYWLLPEFFVSHYQRNQLDNSIVLMDNCNGMGSDGDIDYDLSSALTGDNSAAIGFHNSVTIFRYGDKADGTSYYSLSYGTILMQTIAENLMKGYNFAESEKKAVDLVGSNQKQYMDNFIGKSDDEDEKVFPMISGNGNVALSLSKYKTNEYKVADKLLKVGSKYILSDTEGIYVRNSIIEKGKRIVSKNNTGHMLSNGEKLFFTVKVDKQNNNTAYYEPYDIYSVNIDGSDLKCEYHCDHMVNLITYKNGFLYYFDLKFESASFMKINTSDGKTTVLNSGNHPYLSVGKASGDKIYLSSSLQSVHQISDNAVYSFDIESETFDKVLSGAMLPNTSVNTSDLVYMFTFNADNGHYSNYYVYYINDKGDLVKSAKLPDDTTVSFLSCDGSFAILSKFNDTKSSSKTWYYFNLETGDYDSIAELENVICFEKQDLNAPEDIYFVYYPYNSTRDMYSLHVKKLENNDLKTMRIGDSEYITAGFDYWIVDGFFVNDDFDCFDLS